jgi:hypothetical protein
VIDHTGVRGTGIAGLEEERVTDLAIIIHLV